MIRALALLIACSSLAHAQPSLTRYDRVDVGDTIPNLSLPDDEGNRRTLDALRDGRPTLLYVWAVGRMGSNTPARDVDTLTMIANEYRGRANVVAIASAHMDRDAVTAAVDRLDPGFPVLVDNQLLAFSLFNNNASGSLTLLTEDRTIASRLLREDPDRFDTARAHLDALIAGEPLPEPDRPGARDEGDTVKALTLVRLDERSYTGVASRDFGAHVALTMTDGNAEILTPAGETVAAPRRKRLDFWIGTRQELIQETDGHIRIAGMADNKAAIALYSLNKRGHLITGLFDGSVNQLAAADLDNDGTDDIIAGHNGSDGVAAFSGESLLWHSTTHGNIWTIDAGDITGDDAPEIVHTHSGRSFVVLDNTGKLIGNVTLPISPYTVRVMPREEGKEGTVFVMDSGRNASGSRFGVVDITGQSRWRRAVRLDDSFRPIIEPAPDASAVAMIAGRDLLLFDNTTGDTLGHATIDEPIGMYWRTNEEGTPELYAITERARFRVDLP